MADNLADALRQRGLSTVTAYSLPQIERVAGHPSLAIVELRVPDGPDGASLERVKQLFPGIDVVAIAAFRPEITSLPPVPIETLCSEHERRAQVGPHHPAARRLSAIVRDSNDAITLQDAEGNILAWNRSLTFFGGCIIVRKERGRGSPWMLRTPRD